MVQFMLGASHLHMPRCKHLNDGLSLSWLKATPSHTLVSGHNQANERMRVGERVIRILGLTIYYAVIIYYVRSEFVPLDKHRAPLITII